MIVDGLDVFRIKQVHHGTSDDRLFEDLAIFEVSLHQRLIVRIRAERTWHIATRNKADDIR